MSFESPRGGGIEVGGLVRMGGRLGELLEGCDAEAGPSVLLWERTCANWGAER